MENDVRQAEERLSLMSAVWIWNGIYIWVWPFFFPAGLIVLVLSRTVLPLFLQVFAGIGAEIYGGYKKNYFH